MDIEKIMGNFPKEVVSKVKSNYTKLINEGTRPDIALVRSFNPVVAGRDATILQIIDQMRKNPDAKYIDLDRWTQDQNKIDVSKLPSDNDYWYVPVTLSVTGVNKNGLYKSVDTLKQTAKAQEGWIIPSINDHMDDWEEDEDGNIMPRVNPKDFEISGFVHGIHGEDLPNGEFAIRGIDMIPKDDPSLLENFGVSIGYEADIEERNGSYKDADYWGEQKNLIIVHNARMINQRPSIPEKIPEGEAIGAGYSSVRNVDKIEESEETSMSEDIADRLKELEEQVNSLTSERDELAESLKEYEGKDLQNLKDSVQKKDTELKDAIKKVEELENENTKLRKDSEELQSIKQSEKDAVVAKAKEVFDDKYSDEQLKEWADKDLSFLKELIGVATNGEAPNFDTSAPREPGQEKPSSGKDGLVDPIGKYNRETKEWEV